MKNYGNFDKFATPLLICSRDWKILYKNSNAKKFLKNPRCGVTLDRFFDKADVEYDKVQKVIAENDTDSLCILPIVLDGNLIRALSFIYEDDIAVLFPTFIRYESLYADIRGFVSAAKSDDFRRLLDAYASLKNDEGNVSFHSQSARNAIYDLLEFTFSDPYDASDISYDSELQPVKDTFIMLKEKFSVYLSSLSYRLFIDISGISEYSDGYADMRRFIPIFLNILLFSASISRDRECNAVISEKDGIFLCEFIIENSTFKPRSIRGDSLYAFMESAPAEYLNVLPYEVLCNKLGCGLSYRVDQNTVTVLLRLKSKIKHGIFFRASSSDIFGIQSLEKLTENLISYLFYN